MTSRFAYVAGAVCLLASPLALAQAPDPSMTCPQISQAVAEQNAIIKQQSDLQAQLSSARTDPGDADPAIARQKARIKADRATKRASALVALGRQKQCFK